MTKRNVRVIFDTNVWVSFLIGKRLSKIKNHIADRRIKIVITDQLLTELKIVTKREKLKKYFPRNAVNELIILLETISDNVDIRPTHSKSRDPKDDFLLDLIAFSKADYLVTGDKDLLELNPFKTAEILTSIEFENKMQKLFPKS